MSKSPTTTEWMDVGSPGDWLHNPHAGEMLDLEFLQPAGLSAGELAAAVQCDRARIDAVIAGTVPIDADLDLRLARYFGMSPGFFLGLQLDYEVLDARRRLQGELERIEPRAA